MEGEEKERPVVEDEEKGPFRRCIVSRESFPKECMVRFAIGPGNVVVPDVAARLPGRGMWLKADASVIDQAVARGVFSKAAKKRVVAPDDLGKVVEGLLLSRMLETIGLARKAGEAVMGFDKVKAALKTGGGAVVFAAFDGGADGRGKIEALAGGRPVVTVLSSAELGAAFGRDHAVHALALAGKLAKKMLVDSGRLAGFRG